MAEMKTRSDERIGDSRIVVTRNLEGQIVLSTQPRKLLVFAVGGWLTAILALAVQFAFFSFGSFVFMILFAAIPAGLLLKEFSPGPSYWIQADTGYFEVKNSGHVVRNGWLDELRTEKYQCDSQMKMYGTRLIADLNDGQIVDLFDLGGTGGEGQIHQLVSEVNGQLVKASV